MYLTHNEKKFVVAERFIRTLNNQIYKYITSIWKKMSIDKLDEKVGEYNNIYHITIEVKPVVGTYIEVDVKVMINILKLKLVIML